MSSFFKTTCVTILIVVSLQITAKSQQKFIDSIHTMLVDLNNQIQCEHINKLLQNAIPFSSGNSMNDSLEVYLRLLFSEAELFQGGLLQPVSQHLLIKYAPFVFRIISSFSETEGSSRYDENMMWMAVAKIELSRVNFYFERATVIFYFEQAKIMLLQLYHNTSYFTARVTRFLAEVYEILDKPDSAYLMYRQSLLENLNRTPEEKTLYNSTLFLSADYCRQHNKQDSAFLLFQQALINFKEIYGERSPDYVYWLLATADMFKYMTKYNAALELNFKALAIIQNILGEETNEYALCINDIGEVYYQTGEYAKALPYTEKALTLKQKIFGEDYFDNVVNLHNLATLYTRMGLYSDAIPLLKESLAISKKYFGEDIVYAFDLHPLAEVYEYLGEYDKALPLYQEALVIQSKNDKINFHYPRTLHSLACLYTSLGQYDKAIEYFKQALELKKEFFGEINPEYTKTLNSYAEACLLNGDYQQALSLQKQSLMIDKKLFGNYHPNIAAGYHTVSELYFQKGEFEKAEAACNESLQMQKKIFDDKHPAIADNYDMLGDINTRLRKYDAAFDYYMRAFNIRKGIVTPVHPDYIKSLCNLGTLYVQKNRIKEAAQLFIKADSAALLHIEQSYSSLSEEEKLIYLNNAEKQFQYLPSLLYLHKINSSNIVNRIYNDELVLKSMVLFNQEQVYNSIRKSNDSAALKLYTNWRFNKSFLGQQILLATEKRIHDFDSLQEVTTQMEERLSNISASFQNNTLHPDVVEISNRLSRGEAAIEFIKFQLYRNKWRDSIIYAALVLLPGKKNVVFIPLFEEKQLQKLFRFTNNSEAAVSYLYPSVDKETEASKSLYSLIWKPLDAILDSTQTIYYSPCGLLYKVSFKALHADENKYLCDKYILKQVFCTRNIISSHDKNYFTSASIWGDINFKYDVSNTDFKNEKHSLDNASSVSSYVSASNNIDSAITWEPLPGSKKETENLFSLFSQKNIQCEVDTGSAASEDRFKKMDGNSAGILHIATHGLFLPLNTLVNKNYTSTYINLFSVQKDPMFRSGLILAGANIAWTNAGVNVGSEDGILTAYEISQLDLSNTNLVTISACETALGDIKDNEGVYGLQRAFKMAGVKKILMSLWKVPDNGTMELMTLFYSNLLDSDDADLALRNAQLIMKKKYAPYYWAGFVLTE